jgi:molybdate-binding protein
LFFSRQELSSISRVLPVGSTGGWLAVKRGEADIAPTHLLDEETLTYNTVFLDRYGLRGRAVIVKGYERLIGIIVAKGNPKNIRSVRDFLRDDVIIVNRTKGSGTRVYLDYLLKGIAREEGVDFHELVSKIRGYYYEVKTHTAVAAAVKHGRADAGLGLGVVAKLYDLDFIPLTWEEYDFLIPVDRLGKSEVRLFVETLRNREFMDSLMREYSGYYRLLRDTGVIVQ